MRCRHLRFSDAGSKNNAQATRAESLRAFLIKTAQASPETDREPAFGERCGLVPTDRQAQACRYMPAGRRPIADCPVALVRGSDRQSEAPVRPRC